MFKSSIIEVADKVLELVILGLVVYYGLIGNIGYAIAGLGIVAMSRTITSLPRYKEQNEKV